MSDHKTNRTPDAWHEHAAAVLRREQEFRRCEVLSWWDGKVSGYGRCALRQNHEGPHRMPKVLDAP